MQPRADGRQHRRAERSGFDKIGTHDGQVDQIGDVLRQPVVAAIPPSILSSVHAAPSAAKAAARSCVWWLSLPAPRERRARAWPRS